MSGASTVAPCHCVRYFTHLTAKMTAAAPFALWPTHPDRPIRGGGPAVDLCLAVAN
jgi:hypothetical protein